jgi:hypothetical protein
MSRWANGEVSARGLGSRQRALEDGPNAFRFTLLRFLNRRLDHK